MVIVISYTPTLEQGNYAMYKKASLKRLPTEAFHLHSTLEMTKIQRWFHVL